MKNISTLTAALALCGLTSYAGDWPRWGGPDPGRDMYSPETGLPDHFTTTTNGQIDFKPGTDEADLHNVPNAKWVVKVGSQSYGNVVVAGGKVFIGTNNENPRDPQHQGDRSILMCFDEKTGAFLWQLVVPKLASGKVNDWENLGLLSSPSVQDNRVYLVTSRCEVMCLDADGMANGNQGPFMDEAQYVAGPGNPPAKIGPRDADIIWKYDMMDELGVFPHNASNCSVLIVGDLVYACTSNGQDWTHVNIPSPNSPSLIAINKITGQLAGEDNAGIGPRIFHGEWSSPSMGVVNGRTLIFFGGGDGVCYAFDATPQKGDGSPIVPVVPGPPINRFEDKDTDYLKKVWWYDCNPPERRVHDEAHKYPAPDGPSEVNATPVFWNNRVYVAVGQDPEHGEGVGILNCIDATQTGDITKSAKIWSYDKIHRSLSTVSITPDGLMFIGDFSGFVHCLDAMTGKVYWVHDMKAHMWGSTMVADGKVYCGDEDGDLVVFAASKEEKVLSQTNLGAPIYSTPVVANGVLYVHSNTHLFAFYDSQRKRVVSDEKPKVDIDVNKQ
ncbi:MAG TPA: PQQ-binding-like beta-propeller repeat protein [Candidatus Baltobacteraceae bacterium]|jgi:outer membrane protein assembly factor BamB|nr:PQQ-binding-like beta-propeller repeat protein [Candidatus Baltobacteraceae bacterium]